MGKFFGGFGPAGADTWSDNLAETSVGEGIAEGGIGSDGGGSAVEIDEAGEEGSCEVVWGGGGWGARGPLQEIVDVVGY